MGVTANVAITRIKRNIYMPAAAEATRAAIQPLTATPLTWLIPTPPLLAGHLSRATSWQFSIWQQYTRKLSRIGGAFK